MILPDKGKYRVSQGWNVNGAYYRANGINILGHNGWDVATPVNTPLFAPISGTVHTGFETGGYGYYVFITSNVEIVVGHMNRVDVRTGQYVTEGQPMGLSGNSGFVSPKPTPSNPNAGAHYHIGVRPMPYNANNGYFGYEDPAKYLTEEDEEVTQAQYEDLKAHIITVEMAMGDVRAKLATQDAKLEDVKAHVLKIEDEVNNN